MKIKEPNPYDVLKIRKVNFCPPHFSTTNIEKRYNMDKAICDWIEDNLNGRYYLGTNVELRQRGETSNLQGCYTVGFESKKELSFFLLACPHLKYN